MDRTAAVYEDLPDIEDGNGNLLYLGQRVGFTYQDVKLSGVLASRVLTDGARYAIEHTAPLGDPKGVLYLDIDDPQQDIDDLGAVLETPLGKQEDYEDE